MGGKDDHGGQERGPLPCRYGMALHLLALLLRGLPRFREYGVGSPPRVQRRRDPAGPGVRRPPAPGHGDHYLRPGGGARASGQSRKQGDRAPGGGAGDVRRDGHRPFGIQRVRRQARAPAPDVDPSAPPGAEPALGATPVLPGRPSRTSPAHRLLRSDPGDLDHRSGRGDLRLRAGRGTGGHAHDRPQTEGIRVRHLRIARRERDTRGPRRSGAWPPRPSFGSRPRQIPR